MVAGYTAFLLRRLRAAAGKLEEMATHDALTGLPNRRMIMERLKETFEINPHNRKSLACVYFDLDGFKKVNDTLGHGAGDLLLQEVGKRTRTLLRESDLLARLGGDEFSILLFSIRNKADAEIVCKRIVASIEAIDSVNGKPVKVSASVGCVFLAGDIIATSEEHIMQVADECMYKSKKSGRGQYTIIDQLPETQLTAA